VDQVAPHLSQRLGLPGDFDALGYHPKGAQRRACPTMMVHLAAMTRVVVQAFYGAAARRPPLTTNATIRLPNTLVGECRSSLPLALRIIQAGVWGERGLVVASGVVGEAFVTTTVRVHRVDLPVAIPDAYEDYLGTVARTARFSVVRRVDGELSSPKPSGFIVKISTSPSGLVPPGMFLRLWKAIMPGSLGAAASARLA